MASPKASGRMINRSISESEKIASLSPIAAVLFVMLIPHFNAHGKMMAGPGVIKDEVVPLIPYLDYSNLPEYLQEISDKTNVKWFRVGSKWWLHSLNFNSKHQHLDAGKMGSDNFPSYQPEQLESSSGVVAEFPSAREGFKVLREEEELKTQQHAREQLSEVVEEHREDLVRLFPDIDLPVAIEKLLHHFRKDERLLDPYATALKWFQREFKPPVVQVAASSRASPAVQKSKGVLREEAAINAAQEALRLIRGEQHGMGRRGAEDVTGFDGGAGDRTAECRAASAVSAGAG